MKSSKKLDGWSVEGGGNKRRQVFNHDDGEVEQETPDLLSVSQQIIEALQTQNRILRSMDSRLERLERQDHHGNGLRQHRPTIAREIVQGSWKFLEPQQVSNLKKEANKKQRYTSVPSYARSYGKADGDGLILEGNCWATSQARPGNIRDEFDPQPAWSNEEIRFELPQLVFNNMVEIQNGSGVYQLKIKYNATREKQVDAGIIVGEIEFSNQGFVNAEGADWDRLLNKQKQTQLPYSNGASDENYLNRGWMVWSLSFVWMSTKIQLFTRKEIHRRKCFGMFLPSQTIAIIPTLFACLLTAVDMI